MTSCRRFSSRASKTRWVTIRNDTPRPHSPRNFCKLKVNVVKKKLLISCIFSSNRQKGPPLTFSYIIIIGRKPFFCFNNNQSPAEDTTRRQFEFFSKNYCVNYVKLSCVEFITFYYYRAEFTSIKGLSTFFKTLPPPTCINYITTGKKWFD